MQRKMFFTTLIKLGATPDSIAATPSGNVYIATNHDKIEKFQMMEGHSTLIGTDLDEWGLLEVEAEVVPEIMEEMSAVSMTLFGDEPRFTSTLRIGIRDAIQQQHVNPRGIAVDNDDNIYVADYDNGRILKYSPGSTPTKVIGTSGTGVGQLQRPRGSRSINITMSTLPMGSSARSWSGIRAASI